MKKKVLTQGVFDKAKPASRWPTSTPPAPRDLAKTLPGIGDVRLQGDRVRPPLCRAADLVSKGVLTQPLFDRIKDLVAF